jgi:molybdenum cofactor cytidylyltransferase
MIVGILLAAGNARRFDGTQKLLAPVPNMNGERPVPLVRLAVLGLCEAGLDHVVVLGREAEAVRASVADLGSSFVVNHEFASGMSSSLREGVEYALAHWPTADGLLIALGDQPLTGLTGTGIVEVLVERFRSVPHESVRPLIVAPRYRGEPGNPVLFDRSLAPELVAVTGDRGARSVVERDPTRVSYVDFDRAPPRDVDTLADMTHLSRELRFL